MTLYEEVEAFVGNRPVLIFGALADQVTATLLESYPDLFFACPTGLSIHVPNKGSILSSLPLSRNCRGRRTRN